MMERMEDDDLTPEQFRALMNSGDRVSITPGPPPTIVHAPLGWPKLHIQGGGGVSGARGVPGGRPTRETNDGLAAPLPA